jgi:hypothetical protein
LKSSSQRDDFTFKHCADDQLYFPAHQLERGRHHFHRHREGVILGYPKDKQVWLKAVDKIVCSVGEAGANCDSDWSDGDLAESRAAAPSYIAKPSLLYPIII